MSRHAPEWIRTVRIETPGSTRGNESLDFVVMEDLPSLVWAATWRHWNCTSPSGKWTGGRRLTPDLLVFDLDPGAPRPWWNAPRWH